MDITNISAGIVSYIGILRRSTEEYRDLLRNIEEFTNILRSNEEY